MQEQGLATNKRIEWIDCAKGIGIILVIIGHTVSNDYVLIHQIVRGGIFSFHMPLFFILSAITYKPSEDNNQFVKNTEKAFRHLIVPMLLVYVVLVLIDYTRFHNTLNLRLFIAEKVNALFFSSGVNVGLLGATIPAIGMLWFLVALFLSRTIFDYIKLKVPNECYQLIIICFLSCAGIAASKIQWLPACLDIALAVLFFIWFGNWFKSKLVDIQKKPFLIAAVSLVIWGSTLFLAYAVDYSYMELAGRRYTLFPVCYITAIAGVVALSCISVMLTRFKIGEVLARLGGHSITLYMIHAIENPFPMMYMLTDSNMLNTIVRVCIDIIMCIIIVYMTSHYKKVKSETWQIK